MVGLRKQWSEATLRRNGRGLVACWKPGGVRNSAQSLPVDIWRWLWCEAPPPPRGTRTNGVADPGDSCARVAGWIEQHRTSMLTAARRYAGRAATADDIVQQASLVASRKPRKTLEEVACARAWLAGITRNVGRQLERKRKRRQKLLDLHCLEELHLAELHDEDVDWKFEKVMEVVDRLPAAQRAVMQCVLVDGMTNCEIAAKLQVTQVAVRSSRHRAIRRLREYLQPSNGASGAGVT